MPIFLSCWHVWNKLRPRPWTLSFGKSGVWWRSIDTLGWLMEVIPGRRGVASGVVGRLGWGLFTGRNKLGFVSFFLRIGGGFLEGWILNVCVFLVVVTVPETNRFAAGKMSSQQGKDRLITINLHAGPGSSGVSKTSLLAEHVTGGGVGEVSDVPRVDLHDVPIRIQLFTPSKTILFRCFSVVGQHTIYTQNTFSEGWFGSVACLVMAFVLPQKIPMRNCVSNCSSEGRWWCEFTHDAKWIYPNFSRIKYPKTDAQCFQAGRCIFDKPSFLMFVHQISGLVLTV